MTPDITNVNLTCLPGDHEPLLINVDEVPNDPQVRTEAYLQIQNRSDAGFTVCCIDINLYSSKALFVFILGNKL